MKKQSNMKNMSGIMKKIISVILIVLIVCLSCGIVYALPNTDVKIKITDKLSDKVELQKETMTKELIPVYIWYNDIDQNKVDMLTENATGLTKDNCSIIDTVLSHNVNTMSTNTFSVLEKSDLDGFISLSEKSREEEQIAVEEYIVTHREIAKNEYNKKSDTLLKKFDLDTNNISFVSNYAPLIIANLTVDEIETISNDPTVEQLGYFEEYEYVEESIESAINTTNIDKINSTSALNLTGAGVKVGIIENESVVLSVDNPDGIAVENTTPTIRNTSDGVNLTDYGNVIIVGDTRRNNIKGSHPFLVANTLLSVSPEITLYSSNSNYNNIEAMLSDGVQIITMSLGSVVKESDDNYAYTLWEKWFDHIIANHNVIFLKSAGNRGENCSDYYDDSGEFHAGARISSPGMAYNGITVGAYWDVLSNDGPNLNSDTLFAFSSYKNAVAGKHGCEKPDVVLPSTFNGNGTSNSTPFLAGIIALMYELKPSLSNYPHVTKSIVLASCHRKVSQYNANVASGFISGEQETMQQGLTDRQGAGAPDAWTMACIISQGTYGFATIGGSTRKIHITQPKYGASNMNVSIAWIKDNSISGDHTSNSNIIEGYDKNFDLNVCQHNDLISSSDLEYSSTEMCYFNMGDNVNDYQLNINQKINPSVTKFAYAWSTDKMYFSDMSDEGIYYIKNNYTEKLISANDSNSVKMKEINTPNDLSGEEQWMLRKDANGRYALLAGNKETKYGLSTSLDLVTLTSVPDFMELVKNDDGTVSFVNDGKILSYKGSNCTWKTYNEDNILIGQKWNLEKVNFSVGDTNLDGVLDITDVTFISEFLADTISFNTIQKYLADVNNDGYIDILDATELQKILARL